MPAKAKKKSKPEEKKASQLGGFLNFIREQGVVGLAVGFLLGGAVSGLVKSLVDNIINPVVGLALGRVALDDKKLVLQQASERHAEVALHWGAVVSTFIDFLIVAAVVYFGVKALHLDKLDKKKK